MSRPIHFPLSPLVLGLTLATVGPVMAEDETTDTVVVLGETYRSTATKSALEPEETPQGITVIDAQEMEQQGADTVDQALRYVAGVSSEVRGGAVKMFDTFTIRGFSVQNSFYDGLPLQYLTGWNVMPQIDANAIEQVEVFKGPTSVLYGTMPPGGMVNIIAKQPQESASTNVGVATGSHSLLAANLDSTGQLGDSSLSYRFVGSAKQRESQVDTADEKSYMLAPSLDWQITDNTLLNLNLYYQNDPDMGINSSLPADGMINDTNLGSTSPSTFVGDDHWSSFERDVLLLGYKLNHDFNDQWTFLQKVRATTTELKQENTYHRAAGYDAATGILKRNIYDTDESLQGIALDNQLSGQFNTAALTHNILLGADYQRFEGDAKYNEYESSDADFYAFNIYSPNNTLLDRDTLTQNAKYQYDIQLEQTGVYFQDQITFNQWVLIAGVRYDWYELSSDQTGQFFYGGTWYDDNAESKADDEQLSYRVGALYTFDNGISPFASFATSFEPQTGLDANGNGFDSEIAEQLEAGIKFNSPNKQVSATLSAFHITKKDALVTDPNDVYGPKLQIGETVAKGIELDSRFFITENADLKATYTYMDMEITKDANDELEGTTPVRVPEHSASLWANYYFYDGLLSGSRWGAGARYVGKTQIDALNTGTVPDYTLVDLSVSYDLGELANALDGATTTLVVNNALNEESYRCYDELNCWYGAERAVKVSLNYAF